MFISVLPNNHVSLIEELPVSFSKVGLLSVIYSALSSESVCFPLCPENIFPGSRCNSSVCLVNTFTILLPSSHH